MVYYDTRISLIGVVLECLHVIGSENLRETCHFNRQGVQDRLEPWDLLLERGELLT